MSFYLSANGWTAHTEAKNLARAQYDLDGFVVVHDEPLRNRAANLLRRVADLQLSLASRLDDNYAAPIAA
jgi:hypothetical protein